MDFHKITDEKLNYYVYAHVNKINGKVYIGISKNIKDRWSRNGSRYKQCQKFYNAIKKYGWDNFDHLILIDSISAQMASEIEKSLITKYDTITNGYNVLGGGFEKHISSPVLRKPIFQYDLNGNLIAEWEYGGAVKAVLGVDANKVASGFAKSAGGFLWSYEKAEKINPYTFRGIIEYPVYQYDMNGTYIRKFNTLREAISIYGNGIHKVIRGDSHSQYGYRWSTQFLEKLPPIIYKERKRKSRVVKEHDYTNIRVLKYNLNGDIEHIFNNYLEVYPDNIQMSKKILKQCLSKNKSVYEYSIWSFENNVDMDEIIRCSNEYMSNHRTIDQYDLDGNYIKTFCSAYQIEKELKFDHCLIINACKKIVKTAYGFQWNYSDQTFVSNDKYKGIALPVLQFSLDGKFIAEYKNAITAAIAISDGKITTGSHILQACHKQKQSAYGYQWRLKREYDSDVVDITNNTHQIHKIVQLDCDDNIIKIYETATDAAKSINGTVNPRSHILQVCKGERQTAYGYKWKYIEEV